jgi:hypothetical protein
MSDEKLEKEKKEQVALTPSSTSKIDRWIKQIEEKCDVNISRRALLNWHIEKSSENLSNADLSQISQKFYDEEKFLKSLLRKFKKAKAEGTEAQIEVVVRQKRPETKKEAPTEAEPEDL